jgi:hypothetical protein
LLRRYAGVSLEVLGAFEPRGKRVNRLVELPADVQVDKLQANFKVPRSVFRVSLMELIQARTDIGPNNSKLFQAKLERRSIYSEARRRPA